MKFTSRTSENARINDCIELFTRSSGALLLVTALAKLISGFGHQKVLDSLEPVSQFQFRHIFVIVGLAEMIVGLLCLFHHGRSLRVGLIVWISTCFLGYRISLVWLGYRLPCSCLGNLTDALEIQPRTADLLMKIVLGYLLVGGVSSFFWLLRQKWKPSGPVVLSEQRV